MKSWSGSIKNPQSQNLNAENRENSQKQDHKSAQNTENVKENVSSSPLEMMSLQQARNQAKLKKGASYYEKQASFFERKKNAFVKKKTGLGGGFYPIYPKKQQESLKNSQKNEIKDKDEKKLKEFILKTKKERRNIEKFEFLDENHENTRYNKAFSADILKEMPKNLVNNSEILKIQEEKKIDKENEENIKDEGNLEKSKELLKENTAEISENAKNIEKTNLNEENTSKLNQKSFEIENLNDNIEEKDQIIEEIHTNNENTNEINENVNKNEELLEDNDQKTNENISNELNENILKIDENNMQFNEIPNKEIENQMISKQKSVENEENKEELFEEEQNNQGDECLAPATSDNLKNLLPPSMNQLPGNPSLYTNIQLNLEKNNDFPVAESKNINNLFNMSIKESEGISLSPNVSPITNEASQMPARRISSWFSNVGVASSLNNINIVEETNKKSKDSSSQESKEPRNKKNSNIFRNIILKNSNAIKNMRNLNNNNTEESEVSHENAEKKESFNNEKDLIMNENYINNDNNFSIEEKIENYSDSQIKNEIGNEKSKENRMKQIINKRMDVLKEISKQNQKLDEKNKNNNNFEQIKIHNVILEEESVKEVIDFDEKPNKNEEFFKNLDEILEKNESKSQTNEQIAKEIPKNSTKLIPNSNNKQILNEESEFLNKNTKKTEINPQINKEKHPEAINLCSYQLKLESILSNSQCSENFPNEISTNNCFCNIKEAGEMNKDENQRNTLNISEIWQKSLNFIKNYDIDEAYSQILDSGIYFSYFLL